MTNQLEGNLNIKEIVSKELQSIVNKIEPIILNKIDKIVKDRLDEILQQGTARVTNDIIIGLFRKGLEKT